MFTQELISLLRKYISRQLCSKHTYLHVMEYLITTLNIKERSCEADMKKFSKHFLRDCKQRLSNDRFKHLRWRTLKLLWESSLPLWKVARKNCGLVKRLRYAFLKSKKFDPRLSFSTRKKTRLKIYHVTLKRIKNIM